MKKNGIIKIVLLAAILLLLLNPAIIPFFDASTKAAISSQLRSNFGALAGSNSASVLSWPNIITALVVIILMWLVATVICRVLQKTCMKGGRKETVGGLMMSITKYAAVLITVVWVLGIFGVNLAGIFASLGILSLIVGFGAQSLIEDTITGIFIIFEGHYNVGDIIILDDFRGEVKKIGVRTTVIEDTGHNLKIVNNSDIRNILKTCLSLFAMWVRLMTQTSENSKKSSFRLCLQCMKTTKMFSLPLLSTRAYRNSVILL